MKANMLSKQLIMITILKIINILLYFLSLLCFIQGVLKCIPGHTDSTLLHHCTFFIVDMIKPPFIINC
jgi:hypothetical protein